MSDDLCHFLALLLQIIGRFAGAGRPAANLAYILSAE